MSLPSRLVALARWIALAALVGVLCGLTSALFLTLLDRATALREARPLLVFALPLVGLAMGALLERFGGSVSGGNNLVIDTIHDDGPELPLRMAPIVLFGTVVTHLFGGSAGREGTAVQMGASLTDWVAHRLRLAPALRRPLLAAGVAGGFGAVFGTPIAGTVFGLEFVVLGAIAYEALLPALVASLIGDLTTRALGIVHTPYPTLPATPLTPILLFKWLLFAAAVALTAVLFIALTHWLKQLGQRHLPRLPLRMLVAGVLVVGLWQLVGTSDYLGLGVPTIVRSFADPTLPHEAFLLKLAFTALTLGGGFLGGEVTPLFFIGAALGNALAAPLGLPLDLAAGVGLAALFACASNTPLALSIMAVELLGAHALPHVVVVSVLAYLLCGHRSIYSAQRAERSKEGALLTRPRSLRDFDQPD
jgi:H+/Cl- antiporter ClcA